MKNLPGRGFLIVLSAGVLMAAIIVGVKMKNASDYIMRDGDLLFQDGDCGPFCEAIKKVTSGVDGLSFSHVGMAKKGRLGEWVVLEAISDGVVETPLDAFLSRNTDADGMPKVAVGRLKEEYNHLLPQALKNAEKYIGKPYDHLFDIDNEAYYCSELIYLVLKEANFGTEVFRLEPMTFVDPESGTTFPAWENYFKELGAKIPEKAPGLNPGSMSKSEKLIIFYPYSKFDLLKRRAG